MNDFRKVFSDYGYRLFEPQSIENAIIDAILNKEIRYVLGIPIIIEKTNMNYKELVEKARKKKVLDELMEILLIASKIIEDKQKAKILRKLASEKKIKKQFDENEFRQIYLQYSSLSKEDTNLPSQINYYLSFLFARKQIEILSKIRKGIKLSKTEKEYFSRVIKKKLLAIRELSEFVKNILVKE